MLSTLQTESFIVQELNNKKYLTLDHAGISIVFFTGTNCQYCVQMRDVLDRTMPLFMNRFKFFTINLSENKEVVKKSEATFFISDGSNATIQHVPIVVFYSNSFPFKKFSGNYNVQEFSAFLEDCLKSQDVVYAPQFPEPPHAAAGSSAAPMAAQNFYPQQPTNYHRPPNPHMQRMQTQPRSFASQMINQRQPSQQQSNMEEEETMTNCSTRKFCYLSYKDAYQEEKM